MTILIVGGAAQGKSAFARRISPETGIVDNLQDIVREAMERVSSPDRRILYHRVMEKLRAVGARSAATE